MYFSEWPVQQEYHHHSSSFTRHNTERVFPLVQLIDLPFKPVLNLLRVLEFLPGMGLMGQKSPTGVTIHR